MFVPTYVATARSPRAEELSRQLAEVIRSYRSAHPDLSALEVSQALQAAAAESAPGLAAGRRGPLLAAALIALVLGVFVALFAASGAGRGIGMSELAIVLAVAVLLVTVLVMVLVRRA